MRALIKERVAEQIRNVLDSGITASNIDYLYKLVDIHKDMASEDYWEVKEEYMHHKMKSYSNEPQYKSKEEGITCLETMLESTVDFMKMLKSGAETPEDIEMVHKYIDKINSL